MEFGFETVGNATLICNDNGPVLVTDPWLGGSAYFGSWGMSHQIPEAQMGAIQESRNIWISHGHPDHLSLDSLLPLRDKRIFVSDHVGHRIADFLIGAGFNTIVLKDRQWVELSPRIRIQALAHYYQDSILLVDLGDTLIINMNDTPLTVWGGYIQRIAKHYKRVVLLQLNCFGDPDMNNFFDESGKRIESEAAKRPSIGRDIAHHMKRLGANIAVPFSSLHRYQRSDSVWANDLTPRLDEYSIGFDPHVGQLLPAFVSYDLIRDEYAPLKPQACPDNVLDPKAFGDDWDEGLSIEDWAVVRAYFERRPLIGKQLNFLRLIVGGDEHVIRWSSRERSGVTFEVPRGSLMTAVKYAVFDDLFIGNFMRTTLHGKLQTTGLQPAVNPYLGKWADNGLAETMSDVRDYHLEYFKRVPLPYLLGRLDERACYAIKAHVSRDSNAHEFLRWMRRNVHA